MSGIGGRADQDWRSREAGCEVVVSFTWEYPMRALSTWEAAMSRIFSIALGILFSAGLCSQETARAGEVKLLSALVMKPALAELADSFELTSGHKLTIAYDSAGAVTKRIKFGEAADVAIIQRPTIERLIKEGKI